MSVQGSASDVVMSDGRTAATALSDLDTQAAALSVEITDLTTTVVQLATVFDLDTQNAALADKVAALTTAVTQLAAQNASTSTSA